MPLLATGKVHRRLRPHGAEAPAAMPAGTQTTAVRKNGDCYVLNGTKRFITHGGVGEIFVVTAVTDPSKGTKGISSFILTKPTTDLDEGAASSASATSRRSRPCAGSASGKKEDKLGWRASDTRELIIEDVEVPAENLLGDEGQGFVNFMQTLDAGRIGIAALSLGIAEGAFEQALQVRDACGSSSASRSRASRASQFQLADMATEIEAGQAPDVPRRLARAARQAVQQGSGDGQAVLLRARHARDDQGDPDPRRLRLHQGLSGRAHDARRQDLRDRRRHVARSSAS